MSGLQISPGHHCRHGFTLIELLVAAAVLALLMVMIAQLFNSATAVTTLRSQRMDTDAQARDVLDRMAFDFGQMIKRPDIDMILKTGSNNPPQSSGSNDQISFFSFSPGYLPSQATSSSLSNSQVSLVSYRVSGTALQLERMGKGLYWNGTVQTGSGSAVVFLPKMIKDIPAWKAATDAQTADADFDPVGPEVFRFEYYYLLKGSLGGPSILSDTPWDTRVPVSHVSVEGLQDVAAIVVDIAVIDPRSLSVAQSKLPALVGKLKDFSPDMIPGQLAAAWNTEINSNSAGLPKSAASSIRVYERYFYLTPPPQ